jgi:hypothetical protein
MTRRVCPVDISEWLRVGTTTREEKSLYYRHIVFYKTYDCTLMLSVSPHHFYHSRFQHEIIFGTLYLHPCCYWLWPGGVRRSLSNRLPGRCGRRARILGFQEPICGNFLQHSGQFEWGKARRRAEMGKHTTEDDEHELHRAWQHVHFKVPLHDRGHRPEANSSKRLCVASLQQA